MRCRAHDRGVFCGASPRAVTPRRARPRHAPKRAPPDAQCARRHTHTQTGASGNGEQHEWSRRTELNGVALKSDLSCPWRPRPRARVTSGGGIRRRRSRRRCSGSRRASMLWRIPTSHWRIQVKCSCAGGSVARIQTQLCAEGSVEKARRIRRVHWTIYGWAGG
jgi:hypothetical protein